MNTNPDQKERLKNILKEYNNNNNELSVYIAHLIMEDFFANLNEQSTEITTSGAVTQEGYEA